MSATVLTQPPADCAGADLCRQGIVPSAYVGCRCWFFMGGGELAEDGIHAGRPPTPWRAPWEPAPRPGAMGWAMEHGEVIA